MSIALQIRGVSKRFVAGAGTCIASAEALRCVDLDVFEGDSVAVVGDPATGKTTLLLCAAGIAVPDTGVVRWFGTDSRVEASVRSTYYDADGSAAARRSRPTRCDPHLHLIDGPERLRQPAIARLAAWIESRRARGDAIVVATRDDALGSYLTKRVVTLRAGRAYSNPQSSRVARVAERVADRGADVVSSGGTR